MQHEALRIGVADNVAVALKPLEHGAEVLVKAGDALLRVRVRQPIRHLHKFALVPVRPGEIVYKYGHPIGLATAPIAPGDWVHTHNLEPGGLSEDYELGTAVPPALTPIEGDTFMGFRLADGRAATRRYLAVVSTVNCSATAAEIAVRELYRDIGEAIEERYPHVDGVLAITHGAGCGLVRDSEDHQQLMRTIAGLATHPNIAGYVMLSLGCEEGHPSSVVDNELVQITDLTGDGTRQVARDADDDGPWLMSIQSCGGTRAAVREVVEALKTMLPKANAARRSPIPVGELKLALQCGGSDAASGISANPALGRACDMLVARGATVILGETPEIYGAAGLLTRRSITPDVGRRLIDRVDWWKDYVSMYHEVLEHGCLTLDANPTRGNREGGITTILEKSLGAVAKAGTTALNEVYRYAERVAETGFVFMDTPGADWVSLTGMIAGGATVGAFTTGRGSCYGAKPMPTLKIASNTAMFERMEGDMDVNAGEILTGRSTVEEVGEEIYRRIIQLAGGEKSKSEQLGYGDREFTPWKIGPQM